MDNQNVYYLANFYYGKLRIAVGEEELKQVQSSQDSWEVVDKNNYYQLQKMYDAGKRDMLAKILDIR